MDNFRVFFGYNIYMLTRRQNQIHKFINEYAGRHEVSPTIQEIANRFHLSVSTIHEHLQAIEKKGYLKKDHGQARAMETQDPNEGLIWIPLLGTIAAGQPIETGYRNNFISVEKSKLPKRGNFSALRVSGDEMKDDGVNNGNFVLVRQRKIRKTDQCSVVLINNYEKILSKFIKKEKRFKIKMLTKKRCSACGKKEDPDGRCLCVNQDAW